MKNLVSILILATMAGTLAQSFKPSSTSVVGLVGGIIKARHSVSEDAKYPRKDCPVCKGKGWYMSGDGISKVNCGYCEEDKKEVGPSEPLTKLNVPRPEPPPLTPPKVRHFILKE